MSSLTTSAARQAGPEDQVLGVLSRAGQSPGLFPPAQTPPGWGETFDAYARTSAFFGLPSVIRDMRLRPRDSDPTFNPIDAIRADPDLRDDPEIIALMERGQFDDSNSPAQLLYDINWGRQAFRDMETAGRAGFWMNTAVATPELIGSLALPAGPLAKAFKGASALGTVGRTGAIVGGLGLAQKFATDAAIPALNEPGIDDEVHAAAIAASLGVGIGSLGALAARNGMPMIPSSITKRVNDNFRRMLRKPPEDVQFTGAGAAYDPHITPTANALDEQLALRTSASLDELRRAVIDDPSPNRSVTILTEPATEAESASMLGILRKKYADAGQPLHVITDGDQWMVDNLVAAKRLDALDPIAKEAPVGQMFGSGTTANVLVKGTPGGRLSTSTSELVRRVYRTVSGFTTTEKQLADPLFFPTGANAENAREVLHGMMNSAVAQLRERTSATKMSFPDAYASIVDYLRYRNDLAEGMAVDPSVVWEPAIVKAAQPIRDYFNKMTTELERAGFLKDKIALAESQAKLAKIERSLARAEKQLRQANTGGSDTANHLGVGYVKRTEEPGVTSDYTKPHGLYTTPAEVDSPHASLGGETTYYKKNDAAKVLRLSTSGVDPEAAIRAGAQDSGAGVHAARSLLGVDEFAKLKVMSKSGLLEYLTKTYPDVEWGRYADKQEMIEGLGGVLSRRAGFDAIELIDTGSPEFSEYVALNERAMTRVAKPEVTNAGAGQGRLFEAQEVSAARVDKLKAKREAAMARNVELDATIKRNADYFTAAYDRDLVKANPSAFQNAVAHAMHKFDKVGDEAAPLNPLIVETMDSKPFIEAARAKTPGAATDKPLAEIVGALTLNDLPATLRNAYLEAAWNFYNKIAKHVYDSITDPLNSHGIAEHAPGMDPLAARKLRAVRSALTRYMVNDPEQILNRYHHAVGGKIALQRAIDANPQLLGELGITNADRLVPAIRKHLQALEQAAIARAEARSLSKEEILRDKAVVRAMRDIKAIEQDLVGGLDRLLGRSAVFAKTDFGEALTWLSATGRSVSHMAKLGSVIIINMLDTAAPLVHSINRPRNIRVLANGIRGMANISKRDLQRIGIGGDGVINSRARLGLEEPASGFGRGRTRQVSKKISGGIHVASDVFSKLNLLHFWENTIRQTAGMVAADEITHGARQFVAAEAMVKGGKTLEAALKAVGLDPAEAAVLNKMGLTSARAKHFLELLYKHGLDLNDKPLSETMSKEDFFAFRKNTRNVIKPNVTAWDFDVSTAAGRANRDLFDTITAGMNGRANRSLIAKPGVFDNPLVYNHEIGKIFLQFMPYAFAATNQILRPMAQMPMSYQLPYLASMVAIGSATLAAKNALNGTRTIEETAKMWEDNPLAMFYEVVAYSGLVSYFDRFASGMDMLGAGPERLFGTPLTGGAMRPSDPRLGTGEFVTRTLGPLVGDVDRAARVAHDVFTGKADSKTAYRAGKLLPFNNNIFLRATAKTTGLPVTPESWTGRN